MLRKGKLKATRGRLAILATFENTCGPLSAEEIAQKTKGVDKATVYRSLALLEISGLLRKVDLRKHATYYELQEHHHHHLICQTCGRIEELAACEIETISKKALKESSHFQNITDHSLEFFGTCKSCMK